MARGYRPVFNEMEQKFSPKGKSGVFIYNGRTIHFPYKPHPIIMFSISLLNL
jgi:hypothetical protein